MVAKISDQALIDSSRAGEPSPTAAQHLGQTALKLFARKGYTATSVNEIVEAAGVTKPMLYYYYGSKEQLARRLVVEPLEKLTEKLKALEFDSADPLDREIGWLTAQLEFCREDADRARFVFALYFGPLGAELADAVADYGYRAKQIILNIAKTRPHFADSCDELIHDYVRAIHGQMVSTAIEVLYTDPDSPLWKVSAHDLAVRLITDLDQGYLNSSNKSG